METAGLGSLMLPSRDGSATELPITPGGGGHFGLGLNAEMLSTADVLAEVEPLDTVEVGRKLAAAAQQGGDATGDAIDKVFEDTGRSNRQRPDPGDSDDDSDDDGGANGDDNSSHRKQEGLLTTRQESFRTPLSARAEAPPVSETLRQAIDLGTIESFGLPPSEGSFPHRHVRAIGPTRTLSAMGRKLYDPDVTGEFFSPLGKVDVGPVPALALQALSVGTEPAPPSGVARTWHRRVSPRASAVISAKARNRKRPTPRKRAVVPKAPALGPDGLPILSAVAKRSTARSTSTAPLLPRLVFTPREPSPRGKANGSQSARSAKAALGDSTMRSSTMLSSTGTSVLPTVRAHNRATLQQHQPLVRDSMRGEQTFAQFRSVLTNYPTTTQRVVYLVPCGESKSFPGYLDEIKAVLSAMVAPVVIKLFPLDKLDGFAIRPAGGLAARAPRAMLAQLQAKLDPLMPSDAIAMLAILPSVDLDPVTEYSFYWGRCLVNNKLVMMTLTRCDTAFYARPREAHHNQLWLRRSLKAAIQGLAQIWGLRFCTYYECVLNDVTEGVAQIDQLPLTLCPVCLRKWMYAIDVSAEGCGPEADYVLFAKHEALQTAFLDLGRDFAPEANFYSRRLQYLQDDKGPVPWW